jgi:hypothetical protein
MGLRNPLAGWLKRGMPDHDPQFVAEVLAETSADPDTPAETVGTHRPTAPLLAQFQAAPARLAVRATEDDEEKVQLRAEIDRLRAERKASLHAQAVAFAQAQAKEGKIDTSEVDFYAFLHHQLALLDQDQGALAIPVQAGQSTCSTRVEAIAQHFAARAPIAPRREQVVTDPLPDGLRVVGNGSAGTDEEQTFYEAGKKHAEKMNRRA